MLECEQIFIIVDEDLFEIVDDLIILHDVGLNKSHKHANELFKRYEFQR